MALENIPTRMRAEEIEGLQELITHVILREWDNVVPISLLQDVEEIRRSPAGAVIRMEGAMERLEEDVAELKRTVATQENLAHLREVMNARFGEVDARFGEVEIRFGELEKRMNIRFNEMGKRMDTRFDEMGKRIGVLRLAFFAFLALQVAILVKLFF